MTRQRMEPIVPARVCVGLMTRNEERWVEEAVASLLGQSYADFTLVVVDDASTDGTGEICAALADRDARLTYIRNPQRLGMAANYREVFRRRDPSCELFAWAAGHDRYHRAWLETLVTAIDAEPKCVLAYTDTVSIDADGGVIDKPAKDWTCFDSSRSSEWERISSVVEAKGFGKMIYGLFRVETIEKAGEIPPVLFPDLVFLWRLSCYGGFRHVPEPYYSRRETKGRLSFAALTARQRRNLFPAPGLMQRLPPIVQVPWYFLRTPLPGLPQSLARNETAIRVGFARGFFLRSLRKQRWWRYLSNPGRTLARAYARLRSKG